MKTVITSAFALLTSLLVLANNDNVKKEAFKTATFPVENGNFLKVIVEKPSDNRLEIRMSDPQNKTIMTSLIERKETVTHLKLDVSELKEGEYLMTFICGNQTKTKKVMIGSIKSERTVAVSIL